MASASADSTSTVKSLSQEPEGEGLEDFGELETDGLKEAEETWVIDPPPFIDNAIPDTTNPGDRLEVWKATLSGPNLKGPKTSITCRSWKDTNLKYWTCDSISKNWRHIVGGSGVANPNGWFVWLVWHGKEHGFAKNRVLWTRLDEQKFTPKVQPLQEGKGPGETDLNHAMREAYDKVKAAEEGRATGAQLSSTAGQSTNRPIRESAKLKRAATYNPPPQLFRKRSLSVDKTVQPQREISPSSQLELLSSTEAINLQNSRPKRLKDRAHAGATFVQPVEGTADEDEGRAGLSLTQSETGASSSNLATAFNSGNANGNRQPVAPVTNIVAPGASNPLSNAERSKMEDDLEAIKLQEIQKKKALAALDLQETQLIRARIERQLGRPQ